MVEREIRLRTVSYDKRYSTIIQVDFTMRVETNKKQMNKAEVYRRLWYQERWQYRMNDFEPFTVIDETTF